MRKRSDGKYNVPLLINDRIDVHLAIGSAGIHIGQSDTPLPLARKLVGPDAIIGHSVSSAEEAQFAVDNGADYVGIGPVWSTNSKDVTHKKILGCDGVGAILEVLAGTGVEAVAIGTLCFGISVSTNEVRRGTYPKSPSATTWIYRS